jgi:hypothetical protein
LCTFDVISQKSMYIEHVIFIPLNCLCVYNSEVIGYLEKVDLLMFVGRAIAQAG